MHKNRICENPLPDFLLSSNALVCAGQHYHIQNRNLCALSSDVHLVDWLVVLG